VRELYWEPRDSRLSVCQDVRAVVERLGEGGRSFNIAAKVRAIFACIWLPRKIVELLTARAQIVGAKQGYTI
jgi:hypothetical protein